MSQKSGIGCRPAVQKTTGSDLALGNGLGGQISGTGVGGKKRGNSGALSLLDFIRARAALSKGFMLRRRGKQPSVFRREGESKKGEDLRKGDG